MDSRSFQYRNIVILSYVASILAAPVFWTQIVLQLAFLVIWTLFERVTNCNICNSKSGLTSHARSRLSKRRRPRPQPLNLTRNNKHGDARGFRAPIVPLQFATPAVGGTFYDDPSLTIAKPTVSSQSPLSPQFAVLSRTLEEQLGPLPIQWAMHLSSDRRVFFVHSESGETTWRDPRLGAHIESPIPRSASRDVQARRHSPVAESHAVLVSSPVIETPAPRLPLAQTARVSRWVNEVRATERARRAKLNVLRSRARMAKMQRYMQPLAI